MSSSPDTDKPASFLNRLGKAIHATRLGKALDRRRTSPVVRMDIPQSQSQSQPSTIESSCTSLHSSAESDSMPPIPATTNTSASTAAIKRRSIFKYYARIIENELCRFAPSDLPGYYAPCNPVTSRNDRDGSHNSNSNSNLVSSVYTEAEHSPYRHAPLTEFVRNLRRLKMVEEQELVLSVVLLQRMASADALFPVTGVSATPFAIVCIMLAAKCLQDRPRSNSVFASVSGMSRLALNQLEIHVLHALRGALHVSLEQYRLTEDLLQEHIHTRIVQVKADNDNEPLPDIFLNARAKFNASHTNPSYSPLAEYNHLPLILPPKACEC